MSFNYEKKSDEITSVFHDMSQSSDNERHLSRKLLSFFLGEKKHIVSISHAKQSYKDSLEESVMKTNVKIKIYSEDDHDQSDPEGEIFAKLIKYPNPPHYEIHMLGSINFRIEETDNGEVIKKPGHTPGLIRETVRQLLLTGGAVKVTSSALLTTEGENFFRALSEDPNLQVEEVVIGKKGDGSKLVKYDVTKNSS